MKRKAGWRSPTPLSHLRRASLRRARVETGVSARTPRETSAALTEPGPDTSLIRVPEWSTGYEQSGNALIHGDNLKVLEHLARTRPQCVRCIYFDPPYNNGESYRHYYDSMGHEAWLDAVSLRLKQARSLLTSDGSIWISIDDSELHYLKVAADNIFGRNNFVGTIVWHRRTTRENRVAFSRNHEYILIYAYDAKIWRSRRNNLPPTDEILSRYRNIDGDPRGPWQSVSANAQDGHATPQQFYEIVGPSGRVHTPPKGRCWVYPEYRMQQEISSNNIWFGENGNNVPRIKRFLNGASAGVAPETLWRADDVGTTAIAKKQLIALFAEATLFDTPKPEQLMHRILTISTAPGDLVLDAYLGSGTMPAVAHKMGRKYIGIEIGEHIKTHCVHRLRKVIDGEPGGISKKTSWQGGGAYDFLEYIAKQ